MLPHHSLPAQIDEVLSLARRAARPPLQHELERLELLQDLALSAPDRWRQAVAPRSEELAFWLLGLSLGVAALDLPDAADKLLDVLPGVPGHAHRDLLREVLATQAEQARRLAC